MATFTTFGENLFHQMFLKVAGLGEILSNENFHVYSNYYYYMTYQWCILILVFSVKPGA